jgi:hypothetical protein
VNQNHKGAIFDEKKNPKGRKSRDIGKNLLVEGLVGSGLKWIKALLRLAAKSRYKQ